MNTSFKTFMEQHNLNIDINQRIEELKRDRGVDTYLEAIALFYEEESDHEMETIAKHLNKKIIEEITKEAHENFCLKDSKSSIAAKLF